MCCSYKLDESSKSSEKKDMDDEEVKE